MDMYNKRTPKKRKQFMEEFQKIGRGLRIKNKSGDFTVANLEYVEFLESKFKELEQKNKHLTDKYNNIASRLKNLEAKGNRSSGR